EQEGGVWREPSRDFESPLVSVRERGGPTVAERIRRQPDARQQLARLPQSATVFFEQCGDRDHLLHRVVAPPEMHAGEHVLDRRQVSVETKRLKGARDTQAG